ncbi:uncharacterized protein [Musca autumnalis]|uniref:uncharacterized protein n=1 Tax=Musca autumnalis TaxID=221902 RepID=UPI003CF65A7F
MVKEIKGERILQMISMYRDRECLWNTKSELYRRKDLKERAFKEIGREFNMTVTDVKKKLKSLRATYLLEKKKVEESIKAGCDAGDMYEPMLHWYSEMSFIDDHILTRKPKDNYSSADMQETIYFEDLEHKSLYDSEDSFPQSTPPPPPSKRKRKNQVPIEQVDEINDVNQYTNTTRIDAFSAFANSMAITLRRMPEEVAYKTMAEIQDLLYCRKFKVSRIERSLSYRSNYNNNSDGQEI